MRAEDSIKDVRLKKMEQMRVEGTPPYPNGFRPTTTAGAVLERFREASPDDLEGLEERFALAGRVMSMRDFGKSCFVHVQDETGRLQVYLRRNLVGEEAYDQFRRWADIGDLFGAAGRLFLTRTGELTLQVERYEILAKAIRPLPEKFHGLRDIELRYRKRYQDLIVNPSVRATFRMRAEIIRRVRAFFDQRGFLEVETPMMHPIAGGAAARPFETFHNALEQPLYLRIAPELYLKRLLVGGFAKVYELNKNFRNEGLSTRHNPEFTMIEFYEAYARYEAFMSLTEELICGLLDDLFGSRSITYQGVDLDFAPPWRRLSLEQALVEEGGFAQGEIEETAALRAVCERCGIERLENRSHGELLVELFEETVEEKLIQPTFITQYPVEVSPLARTTEGSADRVDRFELFVAGREVANGFSELNDPEEQRRRLLDQVDKRRQGDDTAQQMDEDFLEALEFGMPPAAGEGIGMDRLVMLFTDASSIRDVILFPQMRPEKGVSHKE
jgi:lysyl-tRNA synthetase class 2